jgi:hypothetical protein
MFSFNFPVKYIAGKCLHPIWLLYRNPDGTLRLRNPHIKKLRDGDFLYHLALGTKSHNLEEMFGDVKVKGFWFCSFLFLLYLFLK